MAGIAEGRLREERRSWRKDHPIGFVARPRSKADGSTDLLNWDVVIPGKKDTMYAFPRPRCLLILVSGRVSTSCRHDGVPARRTRDVLPTVTPSPRRTLMTTPRACRWEGCEFNLTMEFSSDYPATAPIVKFVSRSVLRVGNTWSRRWCRRDATPSRRRRRGRERVCAPRE